MGETPDTAAPIAQDTRREGQSWTPEEFTVRADRLLGVEFDISSGKLFGSESTRRLILGMLQENLGMARWTGSATRPVGRRPSSRPSESAARTDESEGGFRQRFG